MTLLDDIRALRNRVASVGGPGDEVQSWLWGVGAWFTGDNSSPVVTIKGPKDGVFEAERLNIFLGARLYDQTDPLGTATEQAFRPAMWCSTQNTQTFANQSDGGAQDANASFILSDTYNGNYNGAEAALPIALAYSSRYGQGDVVGEAITSCYVGARRFPVPYVLARGAIATLTLQPNFSRLMNENPKTQFQVVVVFSGATRRAA